MNNKMFKRIVATAISVVMLGTCAFAAEITMGNYENETLDFTYTYDAETMSKVTYLAYAAKVAADQNATGANIAEIAGTKYDLCEIIAIDQLEGEAAAAGTKTVSINTALMNVGTNEVPVTAPYIILKSGDDAEGTEASTVLIETGAEEPPVGDTYTVTFIGADGSTAYVTETEVASGTAITELIPATDPTKPNSLKKRYAFIGWYTDAGLTAKLDKESTVTSDITLYSKFSQIGVYGDANGDGEVKAADTVQVKAFLNSDSYSGKAGKEIADCTTAAGKPGLYGDANGDGVVKAADTVQIKAFLNSDSYAGKAGKDMVMVKD